MSSLPFPADSAEFEEYTSVMNAMADEANASAPDPEPEDRYLDSCWEDANECGMEDYCGDFWTLTAHPKGWVPFWLESNQSYKSLILNELRRGRGGAALSRW